MKTFIFTLALSLSLSALAASEGYRRESSALGDRDAIAPQEEVEGRSPGVQREEAFDQRGYERGYDRQQQEDIRIPESEDPGMDYGQFGDEVEREEDIIEVDGFSDEAYEPIGEDQIEINN